MGPFNIRQDEKLTLTLFELANKQTDWWTIHLTSGYFNFTEKYKAFILKTKAKFRFLTASPEVSKFRRKEGGSHIFNVMYIYRQMGSLIQKVFHVSCLLLIHILSVNFIDR
jgi:CDP-diacylglycerol--glycerol-3-phosphate 3-phosphatidyltransferase